MGNLLKDLKIDIHIISNVTKIIEHVQSMVAHLKPETAECQAAVNLAKGDVQKVLERIRRDGYIKDLGTHTWNNLSNIEGMLVDGYNAFTKGNMYDAGKGFGVAT